MGETTCGIRALSGDGVRDFWCWIWSGIAEREHRIWWEHSSSRDVRKEKRACQLVQRALVESLPTTKAYTAGEALFTRLGLGLPAEETASLLADMESALKRAKALASGREIGGDDDDALALVLGQGLPVFREALDRAGVSSPRTPGFALGRDAAIEYLAWLGCTIQTLELAGESPRDEAERADLARAAAAIRMVLAQWIASLPPGGRSSFHTIWERHSGGIAAARVQQLAGWLGQEAARHAGDGDTRAQVLSRALHRLGEVTGLSPEALRAAATPCTPPWTPAEALKPALLGGSSSPGGLVTFTITEGDQPPERASIPLHEFIASLVRR